MTRALAAWCMGIVAVLLLAPPASAQQTRAAEIAAAQAAKAEHLEPYQPTRAERIAARVKKQLVETPDGFYPWFDSVYSGGGFTLGGGYRRFYGDRTYWYTRGLLSAKAYKLVEFATESPGMSDGRVDVRAVVGWRDATQVAFYGVGGDTPPDAKTNFRMTQGYVGGEFRARGPGYTRLDFAIQYEDFSLEDGTGDSPAVDDVHTSATAPGLGASPEYLHLVWTGGIDWRQPGAGYARRGGLYSLAYEGYFDRDTTYTFDRVQGEVVQHVPLLRENWVLSFHGIARTTLDDDDEVPYFLLPGLGSGSTLRAYPSWRFRDRHSLLMSGEFRWIPSRQFLDVALFYDTGKVASRRADLDFSGLKHDWGIGVRFHGPTMTPLRIDVARGSEGFNIVFSGAAPF
jgi:hypothetical protein